MSRGHLPVRILQKIAERAVQDTRRPGSEGGRVTPRFDPGATGLDTDEADLLIGL